MKNIVLHKHPLTIAITLASALPAHSYANPALEEVIVTAQKREQNLQDVPIAITAFSADQLAAQGASSIIDVEKSVPNTQLRASRGTNSTLTAFIRGVGQQDPLWGFEPGVGIYIDDVYIARPQGAVLDIIDIERLEVLRGPQGTLYGKNTIGGAIKYVTRKMSGDLRGNISTSVGAFNQRDVKVSSQIPLIDNVLYAGFSVASLTRDGFGTQFKDYLPSTSGNGELGEFRRTAENYNKDVLAASGTIEYSPGDRWFFKIAADRLEDESNGRCGSRFANNTVAGPNGEFFPATDNVFDSQCGITELQNVETHGYSFTAKYDVSDALSFKYVFAEREGNTQTFIDFDGTPLDSFDIPAFYDDEQTTHELQVNFTNDFIAIVGGLYYYDGTAAGAFDALFGQFSPTGVLSGTQFSNAVSGEVDTESSAIYINANINLSSSLTLTLGGRYTNDEKAADVNRAFLLTSNSFPGTTNQGSGISFGDPAFDVVTSIRTDFNKEDTNDDWNQFTPSVKLGWDANDDVMIYGSYARGFKSGGFDMRADAIVEPNAAEGYDPETVDTFEIGLKSQLFNDRLRMNINIFHSDYQDQQVTVQAPAPPPAFFSSTVVNAGESTIQGIEFESTLQITDDLVANFAFGYLDAEFEEVTELIPVGVDASGNPILEEVNRANRVETVNRNTNEPIIIEPWGAQNAPELTGQLGLSYYLNVGDWGTFAFNTALSYRDDVRMFESVTSVIDQEAYSLWDAGVIWNSVDDHWTASLHAKNITDKEYRTGGYNFPATAGEDAILGFYGDPRTWTLTIGYEFN